MVTIFYYVVIYWTIITAGNTRALPVCIQRDIFQKHDRKKYNFQCNVLNNEGGSQKLN